MGFLGATAHFSRTFREKMFYFPDFPENVDTLNQSSVSTVDFT